MTASKSASTTAKPPSNAEELKAAQAPLKARYRETADSAVVTFRAEGRLDEGIACKVDTGRALVEAGLHPAAGGTGTQACSGDMLLEALRSEEHTSELQSLMRISYAVFCVKKK